MLTVRASTARSRSCTRLPHGQSCAMHCLSTARPLCRTCYTPQTQLIQVRSPDGSADCMWWPHVAGHETFKACKVSIIHRAQQQIGPKCLQGTTTQRSTSILPGGHQGGARTLWGIPAMTPKRWL